VVHDDFMNKREETKKPRWIQTEQRQNVKVIQNDKTTKSQKSESSIGSPNKAHKKQLGIRICDCSNDMPDIADNRMTQLASQEDSKYRPGNKYRRGGNSSCFDRCLGRFSVSSREIKPMASMIMSEKKKRRTQPMGRR